MNDKYGPGMGRMVLGYIVIWSLVVYSRYDHDDKYDYDFTSFVNRVRAALHQKQKNEAHIMLIIKFK